MFRSVFNRVGRRLAVWLTLAAMILFFSPGFLAAGDESQILTGYSEGEVLVIVALAVGGALLLGLVLILLVYNRGLVKHRKNLLTEVTDRKMAEEALRESEQRFRSILDNTDAGYFYIDKNGLIQDVNDAWLKMYKFDSAADVVGQHFTVIQKADDVAAAEEFVAGIMANEPGYLIGEFSRKCADDTIGYHTFSARPVVQSGEVTGIEGFIIDTTERILAEEERRRLEQDYQAMFHEMLDGFSLHEIICDDQGKPVDYRFLAVNPAFEHMTGLKAKDIVGRTVLEVMPNTEESWIETYGRVALNGEPAFFENFAQELDRHYEVKAYQPVVGQFATIFSDISSRKQADEDRETLETQLRQAQKMEALGTLAGGIAHDFNNILAAIIGYSELALDDVETGVPDSSHIKEILGAGMRAKELVMQILTFSRKLEPELKPTDLNQLVLQAENMLARTIPKMIQVEHRLADCLWMVNADPSQLSQVLLNLGTNANDAMSDGGRLVIETENVVLDKEYCDRHAGVVSGDYVLLSVSDTGEGMDKKTLEHIFDPFFTKKEVGKGTGLGLAMVYGIVKNHGGYIMCYSEIGQGATFKIYLPASRTVAFEQNKITAEKDILGDSQTILLVDDEEALRDLGRQILTRQGYRIVLAETGEEALEIYGRHGSGIDLVILDISMPGMGGNKCFLELIKVNPGVKVVFASGYSKNGRLKYNLASGAAGFMPKPFTRTQMLKTVEEALNS